MSARADVYAEKMARVYDLVRLFLGARSQADADKYNKQIGTSVYVVDIFVGSLHVIGFLNFDRASPYTHTSHALYRFTSLLQSFCRYSTKYLIESPCTVCSV